MDIFEGITFEGVPDGMGEGQSRQNRRHLQGSEPRALAGRRARSLIRLRCHVLVAGWEGRKEKKKLDRVRNVYSIRVLWLILLQFEGERHKRG